MPQLTFAQSIVYYGVIYSLPIVEFLLPLFFLSHKFNRRQDYYLRLFFGLPIIFVQAFFLGFAIAVVEQFIPVLLLPVKILSTLFLNAFVFEYLCLMYKEKLSKLLLCAVTVLAVQRFAYEIYMYLLLALKGATLNIVGPVGIKAVDYTIHFSFYFAVELLYCFLFGRKNSNNDINSDQIMVLTLILIIGTVLLDGILANAITGESLVVEIARRGFDMLCCGVVLFLRHELLRAKQVQSDYDLLKFLWSQKEKQFELIKETVNLINTKCHDIRHQLDDFGKIMGDRGTVEELKQSIKIYDGLVKTQNDVLDIILAEKFLYCQSRGIRLHYIVDGGCLDFMSAGDIYAIFGNAIDNAVEYLDKLEEKEKRVFRMFVKRKEGFITGHFENSFEGRLRFENGLPVTDKDDGSYHGYGMLSMRTAVKKLGGTLTLSAKDNFFTVNFIIPVP